LFRTGEEDLIDAREFVAEFAIVDVALNGGQSGSQELLERNEGGGHSARLYSSFDKASKKGTMSQKKCRPLIPSKFRPADPRANNLVST
jgi:hypothetical protein